MVLIGSASFAPEDGIVLSARENADEGITIFERYVATWHESSAEELLKRSGHLRKRIEKTFVTLELVECSTRIGWLDREIKARETLH